MPSARPLLRTTDNGNPVFVEAKSVGATGERWIEPFLEANRSSLNRLALKPRVETRGGLRLALDPGDRVGAIPLLSPQTRKVAAGVLVTPRFRWPAVGAVMNTTGFATEPVLGGAPLVPGSAREVPPWLIAGPVLRRIEGLLSHRRRGFVEREEHRSSPRGRVDYASWARRDVPAGRWAQLPCRFPDPDDDPKLMAQVRWTLKRLDDSLAPHVESLPGRALRGRVREMLATVGPGALARPGIGATAFGSSWQAEAHEAMTWVSEERGLGGARTLDGLAWHLCIDELWESWVRRFCALLAPQLGMTCDAELSTRRGLNWVTPLRSMGSLVPDVVMRGRDRVVIVDAKYKAHMHLLRRKGWAGLSESVRDAHRADLHQALAYAAIEGVERVDTVLVYPGESEVRERFRENAGAVAAVGRGTQRVTLYLRELPFGLRRPEELDEVARDWREAI